MSEGSDRGTPAARPDPGSAHNLDDLIVRLRILKVWAGDPSYDVIAKRVNARWQRSGRPERTSKSTVADCFTVGRARPDEDLVLAIVAALDADEGYLTEWRQAIRIVRGEAVMASFVQAQDRLPDLVPEFTGRTTELSRCVSMAYADDRPAGVVIEGMAGVGKTQLAIAAAHRLVEQHDIERVLFVNLRGFDPDPWRPPANPAAVLDAFLRLLGVRAQDIPHGKDALAARAELYQTQLDRTSALILLDNAVDAEQVEPLLSRVPRCPALVTSRNHLAELPQAGRLEIDVFDLDDAVALLRAAAGPDRFAAEPDAAVSIASLLGGLPLALGLTAGRIRSDNGWTLTDQLERLVDDAEPLMGPMIADRVELAHRPRLEDPVQAALGSSYRRLGSEPRRVLRLLALHPGGDLDSYAAAALAGVDLEEVRRQLQELAVAHLVQQRQPDRYEFHDLVRVYASERTRDEDPAAARHAALDRLLDHYLSVASLVMSHYAPWEQQRRPPIVCSGTPDPRIVDHASATAWLDAEWPNLIATAVFGARHGWIRYTSQVAAAIARYLDTAARFQDAEVLHEHAVRDEDPVARAGALTNLGRIYIRTARHAEAQDTIQLALATAQETGDITGQARALSSLGLVCWRLGRHEEAFDHYRQSLSRYGQTGDRLGEASVLGNLAGLFERLGRFQEAVDEGRRSAERYRELGDRVGEARALGNLGKVYLRLGLPTEAIDHLEQALSHFREVDAALEVAGSIGNIGVAYGQMGRHRDAVEMHEQTLALVREVGARQHEVVCLNELGNNMRRLGEPAQGLRYHSTALQIADELGARYEQARAHDGIAEARTALGDPTEARIHWEQAHALYAELGTPEVAEIAARLAALDARGAHPR